MYKKTFLTVLIIPLISFLLSCRQASPHSEILMDTVCTVNAFSQGTDELYTEIFSRLKELDKTFSPSDDESELYYVNTHGFSENIKVSKDFSFVMNKAVQAADFTGSAFNYAAGPLIDLWGINTDHEKIPTDKEIKEILELCKTENVLWDGETVRFTKDGVKLNFGALVKGYAADCVAEILHSKKIKKAVIDLGGNIYLVGEKEDKTLWKAGIKNPSNPNGNPIVKIETKETSIVTSGNYERFFEKDGKRYHHIFDTSTGYPAENSTASVTVICPSSITADILSTAFFVMGKEKAFSILPAGVEALFIEENGDITASPDLNWTRLK